MSAKPPPKTDDDEIEEEVGFVDDEDDGDSDGEDEFVPGADEDEAAFVEGDEDDEEDTIVPLFDGILSMDKDQKLHFQGDEFHLTSLEPLSSWNPLDPACKPLESPFTIDMDGTCDIETGSGKPTHRVMEVTWSIGVNGSGAINRGKLKAEDDDDEEDGKKCAANPSVVYAVYGRQKDSKSDVLEFRGEHAPSSKEVNLVCQVRMVLAEPTVTAKAPPSAAAAARIAADDDDVDDEADEKVDYDELIALHQEANLSVADIQKRYREGTDDDVKPSSKKGKQADDDDDDYCF